MIMLNRLKKLIRRSRPLWTREIYPDHDIGVGTYGNPEISVFDDDTRLRIGRYCSIANGVKILLGGEHRIDWVTTYPFNVFVDEFRHISGHPKSKGDVVIGHDVWIGTDALILSGVNIGHGAVITSRAVVTKDVRPYAIVGGVPAVEIRRRFDDWVVDALLEIAWWNWSEEKIYGAADSLLSCDVKSFIEFAKGCNKDSVSDNR
jgi:acetyltransferase-like isoleucine patch superfamily enzyme